MSQELSWDLYRTFNAVLRDEGTSYHYAPPSDFADADPELVARSAKALAAVDLHAVFGSSGATDAPFRKTAEAIAAAQVKGLLAVEMEAAALYAFAGAAGARVLCLAYVTIAMGTDGADFKKGEADGTEDALPLIEVVATALHQP